jgi:hypothetical protein
MTTEYANKHPCPRCGFPIQNHAEKLCAVCRLAERRERETLERVKAAEVKRGGNTP